MQPILPGHPVFSMGGENVKGLKPIHQNLGHRCGNRSRCRFGSYEGPPCTDTYARWRGRGEAARFPLSRLNTALPMCWEGLCSRLPGSRPGRPALARRPGDHPRPGMTGNHCFCVSFYRSSSSDWHSLAIKVAVTSSSAGMKGAGGGGAATLAFFSACRPASWSRADRRRLICRPAVSRPPRAW
jgi:hypothetical protein